MRTCVLRLKSSENRLPQPSNVHWNGFSPVCTSWWRFSFELSKRLEDLGPRRKSRLHVPIGGQTYPHLTSDALGEFIGARAPWFDRKIENVRWSLGVRFEQRLAEARIGEHQAAETATESGPSNRVEGAGIHGHGPVPDSSGTSPR